MPQPVATSGWPDWFRVEQLAAHKEFENTPAPTRRDEAWRFANIAALDLARFTDASGVTNREEVIKRTSGLASVSARFVFANNQLVAVEDSQLPDGVIALPLDQAAKLHPDLFRKFFMAQPVELGSHKYAALHKSKASGGIFLFVPEGVKVEHPVEVFHWVSGENSSVFPHTLVVCAANSHVSVIDRFGSLDGLPAFACGVNDLHVDSGARLSYSAIQDWSTATTAFHLNSTTVGENASCTSLTLNFGGAYVRGESLSRLVGERGRSEMFSLNPVEGTREIDQRTLQDHAAPNASSDLLYLNALDDRSRTIFAGLIKVEPGAHGTDAYQKVRNLILSDEADPNSMPGLEILNDDVRCTHGATNGPVDEEELFYMQARGIQRDAGRRLVVNGFFQTLIDRLEASPLRDHLSELVARRLGV